MTTWWKTIKKYYHHMNSKKSSSLFFHLGSQIVDDLYSLGKSLTDQHVVKLASNGSQKDATKMIFTSVDVIIDGFCSSRFGKHESSRFTASIRGKSYKFAYIWVHVPS
ncbi:hypothetical protein FNV43_RR11050 [Rhamnella rubrinervis]|uniref:Uncharacterized protein n=1 Tax=Rhamnella rubrinervis TaxID=2594499 RepID=A0A8K0H5K9_9ROSA|nr:hypothetical protein FNV43_RR11050 [Rhamnella rubrinervis]